jgi:hypothetical protein
VRFFSLPRFLLPLKGKDKWELNRDAATKVTGDLKVGSKVTIEYTMKATTVEVKADKKADTKKKK